MIQHFRRLFLGHATVLGWVWRWARQPSPTHLSGTQSFSLVGPPAPRACHLHVANRRRKDSLGSFVGQNLEGLLITSECIPRAVTWPHRLPGIWEVRAMRLPILSMKERMDLGGQLVTSATDYLGAVDRGEKNFCLSIF